MYETKYLTTNPYLNLFHRPFSKEYELAQKALENLGIEYLSRKIILKLVVEKDS